MTWRQQRRETKILRTELEAVGLCFSRWPVRHSFNSSIFRHVGPAGGYSTSLTVPLRTGQNLEIKVIAEWDNLIQVFAVSQDQIDGLLLEINRKPPAKAELLLSFFLTHDEREGAIGDFNEKFVVKVEHLGRLKAVSWAYRELLRSISPLVQRKLRMLFSRLVKFS